MNLATYYSGPNYNDSEYFNQWYTSTDHNLLYHEWLAQNVAVPDWFDL